MTTIGDKTKLITEAELNQLIDNRKDGERIEIRDRVLENMDLSGRDLSNIDFGESTFNSVNLDGANLDHSSIYKTWFADCSMRGTILTNADMREASLRHMDMTDADISGSNLFAAILEYATLDGVKDDENTQFYRMCCPEEGPFIGWKCCTEWRVVQLLIPADAKRVSATMKTCRCNKAKVLSIKSIDETVKYDWAQSTVDPDFYYEVGKWVEPANRFEEDRWMDSSPGIHFFMDRQDCVDYQTK